MDRELNFLSDEDRLAAYQTIVNGCQHLWSKGKLVEEKLYPILDKFYVLAEKDPYFLAHFTSYAIKKLESKDLKVVSVFINSLSDADGTSFSLGSKFKKPNLRVISQAAIHYLNPKLVLRVVELANLKKEIGSKKKGTHFSRSLKTSIKKYIKYRETNINMLEGGKKTGLGNVIKNIYRFLHMSPSTDAASVLNWQQKDGRQIEKKRFFDFTGLSELEIAEKIVKDKLRVTGVMGAIPEKMKNSAVIAGALLQQASPDEAVILTNFFDESSILQNESAKKLYTEKISGAKNALDRVDHIKKDLEEVEVILKKAKAEKRKEDVGDIGSVFVHIDVSSSMQEALIIAKDSGAIIAECVKNPEQNFHWGTFEFVGKVLKRPELFIKDAFAVALFGIRAYGNTNCLANYKIARELGCEVDFYITDQGHNGPDMNMTIQNCISAGLPKPKAVVIVNVGVIQSDRPLKCAFERNGIPVTEITPETLKESALVSQAIRIAVKGQVALVDEIMAEPLLTLPKWWYSV